MSSFIANNPRSSSASVDALSAQLQELTPSKQIPIIHQLHAAGELGDHVLMGFLLQHEGRPTIATGCAYHALATTTAMEVVTVLRDRFPNGVVPLPQDCQVDYSAVQQALMQQAYEDADRLTLLKLCELAGSTAIQRKWLYFTEVAQFPVADLRILDTLWSVYSEGKFGFAKQREIWLSVGKNWERLWPKIAWKKENLWTRYPKEFIWNLTAPEGHLPLSNQLRGVRVMDSLMNHPAWEQTD